MYHELSKNRYIVLETVYIERTVRLSLANGKWSPDLSPKPTLGCFFNYVFLLYAIIANTALLPVLQRYIRNVCDVCAMLKQTVMTALCTPNEHNDKRCLNVVVLSIVSTYRIFLMKRR